MRGPAWVVVLAGPRGLTHRAVDREAHLPAGSTSNLFRTREALVGAIVDDLVIRDKEHLGRMETLADAVLFDAEVNRPAIADAINWILRPR